VSEEGVQLRVAEAYQRDVGRKIARIPRRVMEKIGVSTGDFIKISGKERDVVAVAWPLRPNDEDKDIIRIDGFLREALGVSIGDIVTVYKAPKVEPAQKVVLAPLQELRFGPDFVAYVKEFLLRKPIARGEIIIIPVWEGIPLAVVSTQPAQIVYVTHNTEVVIREKPVKEEEISRARGVPRVTWEDIGDLEEAKERIREIVELPMKHPELFRHLGIEPPKGILLYGPPGTGKTLLAKALANEIGAYFITINGPEIMSKYYGESEQRLREIFKEAEENAPNHIHRRDRRDRAEKGGGHRRGREEDRRSAANPAGRAQGEGPCDSDRRHQQAGGRRPRAEEAGQVRQGDRDQAARQEG